MKKENLNKKGFTLIELLVVVLIIGILAAIALPQYRKAVRKSRVAEAKIVLRALSDAQDRYFLTTGEFDYDLEEVDIDVSKETKNWTFVRDECLEYGCGVYAIPKWESGWGIEYWSTSYDIGSVYSGNFFCYSDEEEGQKICKALSDNGVQVDESRYKL